MSQRYHFQKNIPGPDPAEIAKRMDFDGLLAAYQAESSTPPPRQRTLLVTLLLIGATAAAVAGFFLIWPGTQSLPSVPQAQLNATAYFKRQPLVAPPLAQFQPRYQRHRLPAAAGGTLALASGTRLVFPQQAFQNDRGQAVGGEVEILYRELRDAADYCLAGVPLRYDSAGRTYHLAPVGMVEILGYQNGQRIQLAPGKSIAVELVSTWNGPTPPAWSFNVYQLDTLERSWQFTGASRVSFVPGDQGATPDDEIQVASYAEQHPRPLPPVPPIARNPKALTLELEEFLASGLVVDAATSAVVREHGRNAIWQIAAQQAPFDTKQLQETWESFTLRQLSPNTYELVLLREKQSLRLLVNPVLFGSAFDQAQKAYAEAQKTYEQALKQWEQDRAEWERRPTVVAQPAASNTLATGKIINRFVVNAFGWWNCDRPKQAPAQRIRLGDITDQKGNEYNNHTAYLFSPETQTLIQFHTGRGNVLFVNPLQPSLIWLITPEGQVATCSITTKMLTSQQSPKGLPLEVAVKQPAIRNEADLRAALQLR